MSFGHGESPLDSVCAAPTDHWPRRLLTLLGQGSFGSVYLGQIEGDLGFRQVVAVKLVDPALTTLQPQLATALIDEAHLLAKLHHPNIVSVRQLHRVSHDVLGETVGMEMEYVEGQTLTALMNVPVEGPLPISAVVAVLAGILDGLAYAHGLTGETHAKLGLVHRDLKPDNLMVDLQGQLRILDFGIAWVRQRRAEETEAGLTKGTLAYMSPEQVRGQELTPPSDLYSVGVMAFEALAGEPYVVGLASSPSDRVQLLQRLVATRFEQRRERLLTVLTDPDGVHDLGPSEAARLEEFLGTLLAAHPNDRAGSGREALRALEGLYDRWRPEEGRRELARRVERSAPTRPLSAELFPAAMPPAVLGRPPPAEERNDVDETDDTDDGLDIRRGRASADSGSRTCMSSRHAEARGMVEPCWRSLRASPWSGTAPGWSGPSWTGTSPRSACTEAWAPCRWTSGPAGGWPVLRCGRSLPTGRGRGDRRDDLIVRAPAPGGMRAHQHDRAQGDRCPNRLHRIGPLQDRLRLRLGEVPPAGPRERHVRQRTTRLRGDPGDGGEPRAQLLHQRDDRVSRRTVGEREREGAGPITGGQRKDRLEDHVDPAEVDGTDRFDEGGVQVDGDATEVGDREVQVAPMDGAERLGEPRLQLPHGDRRRQRDGGEANGGRAHACDSINHHARWSVSSTAPSGARRRPWRWAAT